MDVVICTAVVQDAWREALAEHLPEARIHVGADAPHAADGQGYADRVTGVCRWQNSRGE